MSDHAGPAPDLDAAKKEIRKIAHDISNPVGILRMAVYYLETAKPEEDKARQYYQMMNQNIDRIEGLIRRLREIAGSSSVQGPHPEIIG